MMMLIAADWPLCEGGTAWRMIVGMNAVARTIGGAVGGQVSATILASTLLASGLPAERGYTISFLVSVGVLAVGIAAALAVPGRAPRRAKVLAAGPTLSVE